MEMVEQQVLLDLEHVDSARRTAVLLRLLQSCSNGRDISHYFDSIINSVFLKTDRDKQSRLLCYDVLRYSIGNSHYSQWESAYERIVKDLNNDDLDLQSAALGVLPILPKKFLDKYFSDESNFFTKRFAGDASAALVKICVGTISSLYTSGTLSNSFNDVAQDSWTYVSGGLYSIADDVAHAAFLAIYKIAGLVDNWNSFKTANDIEKRLAKEDTAFKILHHVAVRVRNTFSLLIERGLLLPPVSRWPCMKVFKALSVFVGYLETKDNLEQDVVVSHTPRSNSISQSGSFLALARRPSSGQALEEREKKSPRRTKTSDGVPLFTYDLLTCNPVSVLLPAFKNWAILSRIYIEQLQHKEICLVLEAAFCLIDISKEDASVESMHGRYEAISTLIRVLISTDHLSSCTISEIIERILSVLDLTPEYLRSDVLFSLLNAAILLRRCDRRLELLVSITKILFSIAAKQPSTVGIIEELFQQKFMQKIWKEDNDNINVKVRNDILMAIVQAARNLIHQQKPTETAAAVALSAVQLCHSCIFWKQPFRYPVYQYLSLWDLSCQSQMPLAVQMLKSVVPKLSLVEDYHCSACTIFLMVKHLPPTFLSDPLSVLQCKFFPFIKVAKDPVEPPAPTSFELTNYAAQKKGKLGEGVSDGREGKQLQLLQIVLQCLYVAAARAPQPKKGSSYPIRILQTLLSSWDSLSPMYRARITAMLSKYAAGVKPNIPNEFVPFVDALCGEDISMITELNKSSTSVKPIINSNKWNIVNAISDPVHVLIRHDMYPETRRMILHVNLQNKSPIPLNGVRVIASFSDRIESVNSFGKSVYTFEEIPFGAQIEWEIQCRVKSFGSAHVNFQVLFEKGEKASITISKATSASSATIHRIFDEAGSSTIKKSSPSIRTIPYKFGYGALLKPLGLQISEYLEIWSSAAASFFKDTASNKNLPIAKLISAVNESGFNTISKRGGEDEGGFVQLAFACITWFGDILLLGVTGTLGSHGRWILRWEVRSNSTSSLCAFEVGFVDWVTTYFSSIDDHLNAKKLLHYLPRDDDLNGFTATGLAREKVSVTSLLNA